MIKVRGSKHSRQIRTFEIDDEGKVVIASGPAPVDGVLLGNPQSRQP